jgi:hypothetical protein
MHGLLKLPRGLKHLVQDYEVKVYDIAFLEDDVIEKFTSDFKVLGRYLKNRRLKKLHLVVEDQQEIHHVEAVLDLFRVFTHDERYEELLTEKIKTRKQKGEVVNMCYVLDYLEQRGIERGRLGLLKKWVEKGKVTLEEAAEEMEQTLEILDNAIYISLRRVDASTRYSSRQVIVLLMDTNSENGQHVAERVINCFEDMNRDGHYTVQYDIAKMPARTAAL